MKLVLALFLWLFVSFAYADEIALTFDDLPAQQDESAEQERVINERIIKALKTFHAPAIGFVNEIKLYSSGETKEKIAILKMWVDNGYPLGNHTYSHQFLRNSNEQAYQNEVIKGSKISKQLMMAAGMPYQYFRHPYLDTGTSKKVRTSFESFLKKEGYRVAPVTVDTDDWKFNQQLLEHPQDKDKILAQYLVHTKAKFAFYKKASQQIFGRNIAHIWLLHVNLLNSYALPDLLKIAKALNYQFISLDTALKDDAYLEPDNYYQPFGVSWLYRWDYTRGKVVDWSQDPEPDNNPFITEKNEILVDKVNHRSLSIETYVSGESMGKAKAGVIKLPTAIIYHDNTMKKTSYDFLAKDLAARGYFVVIIQHDLNNKRASMNPSLMIPFGKRGVQNIHFVITALKKTNKHVNFDNIVFFAYLNHSTS